MTEITNKMIEEAKDACKPGSLVSAAIMFKDIVALGAEGTVGGAAIGSIVPVIGTTLGAEVGGIVGVVGGVVAGRNDANVPDAACVAKNLQNRSR